MAIKRWLRSLFVWCFVLSLLIFAGLVAWGANQIESFRRPTVPITPGNVDQLEIIVDLEVSSGGWRNRWDTSIQFSLDSRILSLSAIDGAHVLDVEHGDEILHIKYAGVCAERRCENLNRKDWPPFNSHAQALSPDGQWLALGISRGNVNDLRLWDIESGEVVRSFGSDSGLQALAFSPDGQNMIFTSQNQANDCLGLCLWHGPTDELIHIDEVDERQEIAVQFEFTIDGQNLIYTSPAGIHSYDFESHESRLLIESQSPVLSLDLTTDYSLIGLIFGTWSYPSQTFSVWDLKTRELLYNHFQGIGAYPKQILFGPNNDIVATSTPNGLIRLWDAQTGAAIYDARVGHDYFQFSPDGRLIVGYIFGHTINIINVETGELISVLEGGSYYRGRELAFSPDGTMLVTADGEIWSIPQ